ncbi:hypothetical protein HKBW3S03_01633, partial [Candidatus Hakubella thermalkaliphila]
MEHGCP